MTETASRSKQAEDSLRAYALLVFTTLCWGFNAVFGRLAVGEVSPMAVVAGRWGCTMLLLLVLAHNNVIRDWPALRPRLGYVAAMGVFGYAVFNGLFYMAAHYTTALNIGILQGSMPVFVLLGAFLVYRTAVTRVQAAGVAATVFGVVTIGSGGDLHRLAALALNQGDLLMIAACMLYAGYTVGLRRRPQASSLGLFAVMASAAFLASLPLLAGEIAQGRFQWPTPTGWGLILAIAIFPSFLAQIAFIKGVELIGPGRAGVFINLVPVFASILAIVVLSEPFKPYHAVALALVLGGIWLSERGKPKA